MAKVKFSFYDRNPILKDRQRLKGFIEQLFKKEGACLQELCYVFCSDEYLLSVNQEFLQHDFYTDIISFDLSSEKDSVIGEVYISADRVRDNAKKLGIRVNSELHRVIFHGALHLCGYKDKSKEDIKRMRFKEDQYLKHYFSRLPE